MINALSIYMVEFEQVLQQRAADTLKLIAIVNDPDSVVLCGWE